VCEQNRLLTMRTTLGRLRRDRLGGVKSQPMTERDGQDLFGLSPAPAPAADHTALMAEWKQGLAHLAPTRDPCPGFRAGQWLSVHAAALDFLANTAETAAALGWSTVALFGVHPVVGVSRVDCCGALRVSSGSPITEVTPECIRYRNGLAYRRTPLGGPSVPVWQVAAEQGGAH
jgi:hypothetical protein